MASTDDYFVKNEDAEDALKTAESVKEPILQNDEVKEEKVTTDAAITGDSEHVAANTDALKTDEPVKVPIPQYDEEKVEKFTTDVAITEDGALKNDDAVKTAEVTLKAVEEPVGEANMKKASVDSTENEKPPRPPLGAVVRLFRYSTPLDWFLMLIGAVAAIGGGVATPVSFLFFGDVITAFTYYSLTYDYSHTLFHETVLCDNLTLALAVQNLSTSDNAVSCVDAGGLVQMVNTSVYSFIGLALGTFLCSYLQIFLYQTACERQLYKIRLYYYRAILRQDIGWFDGNPSGELASRLSELSPSHVGFVQFVG